MNLTKAEIEFLAAWAREEWETDCYQGPAHRLQLDHRVPGALLIGFIKAWTSEKGKKDKEILEAASNPNPCWPWADEQEFGRRLRETGAPFNSPTTAPR